MCGQLGIILGPKDRTKDELDYFRKVFTYLLLLNEDRGPHATGIAWLKRTGECRILKRPQKARDFVRDSGFRDALAGVDSSVTWLAGHTRWQTVGDASNNRNNHPIRAGEVIGTHNGTILNADSLFTHFRLPRSAEVDSELVFRLADSTVVDGRISVATFKSKLALCSGGISAVMASRLKPEEIIAIKGNKPLGIRYNEDCQAVVYSSEAGHLEMALAADRSWKRIDLRTMAVAVFKCDCLRASTWEPFSLSYYTEADRLG